MDFSARMTTLVIPASRTWSRTTSTSAYLALWSAAKIDLFPAPAQVHLGALHAKVDGCMLLPSRQTEMEIPT